MEMLMPSTSKKQHNFMAAIANNPSFAKKVGVKQSVGKDFNAADKGRTFAKGGVTQQKINKQNTRHGMMDLPVANLSRFSGMKKGGIMKKRRFDGEEGSLVDDDIEPVVERRSFAKGVRTNPETGEKYDTGMRQNQETGEMYSTDMKQNEETGEMYRTTAPPAKPAAKAAAKPAAKPAAKRNLDSAGSSKVSPAQEAVLQRMERDKARGTTSADRDPDVRRLFSAVKPAAAKTDSSFGNYFKDLVTKTRAERYAEANPKKLAKGGAVMKEPKDAMMPRRPRGMTPPVAPQSPMGMGMKKGGMPMKDGKPAFMKKFAAGGNINPKGSMTGSSRAGENTKIQKRGLTEGRVIKMASGGSVSSASRRADGIAQRGKTRC